MSDDTRKPYGSSFWACLDKSGGDESCWIWKYNSVKGYGRVRFNGKDQYAHRVSYILFNGEIQDGLEVLHKCDVPLCCNPRHLFLGTQVDNLKDMTDKGRRKWGDHSKENNPKSKLTTNDVIEIRERYSNGKYRQVDLAEAFGVSQAEISQIVLNKVWRSDG